MTEYRLYDRLIWEKPRAKICEDEKYTYFEIVLDGFVLTYRRTTQRTDGRRLYKFDDNLAAYLGYGNVGQMLDVIVWWKRKGERGLKLWSGYVTPQALKKHFYSRRWKLLWDVQADEFYEEMGLY